MQELNDYKTVAIFDTAVCAWIFRNRLSDLGLNPVMLNEHLVGIVWIYSTAYGGIKIQLPAKEFEQYEQMNLGPIRDGDESKQITGVSRGLQLTNRWEFRLTIAVVVFTVLYLLGSSFGWIDELSPDSFCPVGESGW